MSIAVESMNIAMQAERQADEARDEALSARRALAVTADAPHQCQHAAHCIRLSTSVIVMLGEQVVEATCSA